ncbi:MAG: protein phosphatase 2C domain-containing protein [Oscillospiraceae bacterium]|nr:protein phosphatase 2C domain-containing protein [Oscillospiraceae bacterium]
MFGYYNLSLQGRSHKAGKIPCQDANRVMVLSNGTIVAAIADGLGSAPYSDIGSFLAVDTVVEHMKLHAEPVWNIQELHSGLKSAFTLALERIQKKAKQDKNPVADYDTTLTAAVYDGSQVVYAHVGDGGIITLSSKGKLRRLTEVQKGGEFNSVCPLKNVDSWVFGQSKDNVCAFSLFTDGIYDVVCPWLLAGSDPPIYINYVRPFMDRNLLKAETPEDFSKIKKEVKNFLESEHNSSITDDKTVVTIINTEITPKLRDESYYAEPDWQALQQETRKKLYTQN